jgi:quinol monooxygenase YgiN
MLRSAAEDQRRGQMDEVVVSAHIPAKEGHVDALVEAFAAHTAGVHAEHGCLLYAAHRAPDGVLVLERWASTAALDAHGSGAALKALGAAIGPFVAGPAALIRAVAVPSGDAAKGTLA